MMRTFGYRPPRAGKYCTMAARSGETVKTVKSLRIMSGSIKNIYIKTYRDQSHWIKRLYDIVVNTLSSSRCIVAIVELFRQISKRCSCSKYLCLLAGDNQVILRFLNYCNKLPHNPYLKNWKIRKTHTENSLRVNRTICVWHYINKLDIYL